MQALFFLILELAYVHITLLLLLSMNSKFNVVRIAQGKQNVRNIFVASDFV